jgi:hypothetical protein
MSDYEHHLQNEVDELRAEIERLREVLRDGADFATDTDDPVLHAWAKRARALQPKGVDK